MDLVLDHPSRSAHILQGMLGEIIADVEYAVEIIKMLLGGQRQKWVLLG